ncbi:hypothetical protein [Antarctobacter sp.]|uniref:hypothetical protein n=1 Tax=Antarctobacter sp. TaxID=1872577 RepID=UPI002B277FA4|nr:hypothetical protein [Antarctobacter sp.]
MLKHLTLALALLVALPAAAKSLDGTETYDLLFRNGTLDEVSRDATLVYQRSVTNTLKPEAGDRDSGDIALSFSADEPGLAQIEFRKEGKARGLGRFPASVGNPMIMFFYESVIRDMAESAGGSPFYIRNRVKEALVQPSDVVEGEAQFDGRTIATRTISLYPFRDDPNRDRMQGFGDLELQVVMSDDVPGWYLALTADASGAEGGPVYRSEITFDELEGAE